MNISGRQPSSERVNQCQCAAIIQDIAKEVRMEQIFEWNAAPSSGGKTTRRQKAVRSTFSRNFDSPFSAKIIFEREIRFQ